MKKLWFFCVLLVPLLCIGIFTGCDNGGGLSGYYIYALLNGTAYEWKLGLTMVEDDAFSEAVTGDPATTVLFASPDVESGLEEPDNYVLIEFEGTSAGTYTIADLDESGYIISGVDWMFTSITLVVTAYGEVGGTVEGTFSGTIQQSGTSNTMTVEDGQFRVIRVEDDAFFGSPS